jgi:predicted nucleotidyltransferase
MRQLDSINVIREVLSNDNNVKAIFLKGSIARDTFDEYSDVDLYCMVEENELQTFLSKRIRYMEHYRPLIFWQEVNFVGPQIVGVFDNGLHFDLYTVTPDSLHMTDEIKVLYDPEGLLSNYKSENLGMSEEEFIEYFNEISFTILELEAAYKRNDLIWASRLGSHISGYVAIILRYIYDYENARLGFKRLNTKLDNTILKKLMEAMELLGPSNVLQGVSLLLEIVNEIINTLPKEISYKINRKFFHFMFDKIRVLK